MSGFLNLKPAGAAGDPLSPVAAWDSGDLGSLAATDYSDGTYTVGGKTATVEYSANCTRIGPDGTNGIAIETPSDGYQFGGVDTAVRLRWDVSDLIGETPQAGWVYIAQFVISAASDEPSTTDDGMCMGFYETPSTNDKAAMYQHLSNRKSTYGGGSRYQNILSVTSNLRTANVMFVKDWYYAVRLSASEQSTPMFDQGGYAPYVSNTLQLSNPSTMDPASMKLQWGTYMYPAVATPDTYILERVRLWVFGK